MNTTRDSENIGSSKLDKEKCEMLIKSSTFINGEKVFQCSSGVGPIEGIQNSKEGVEICFSHNNLSDHVKGVMVHVNDYFTKKIKEEKNR
ncbi:hypothetical protein, conserved [Plasmodium gonderi]|uniref:Uncharacterized protein n=1 Tax=Plasmodium gonderi TaxID=77519 RepID=A0A1Y1JIX4_PLAGO|nr:hypothetical protein, conserved [Plasmodium gonderi]GAW81598.1 hypothetical protein, conserved [Plasmodium gonderi]